MALDNGNPGNLRDPQTGDFQTFDSPEAGVAAMRNDLLTKISGNSKAMAGRYGDNYSPTLRNVITTYAPPTENDTEGYVKYVAGKSGLDPDSPMQTTDVEKILPHMLTMESGPKAAQYADAGSTAAPAAQPAAAPARPSLDSIFATEANAASPVTANNNRPSLDSIFQQTSAPVAKPVPTNLGFQPTVQNSFGKDLLNNAKGVVQNAKDLITGNFETPLNPKTSPNSDNLATKLLAGSDDPTDPSVSNLATGVKNTSLSDYSKLFNEKVAANPFTKAGTVGLIGRNPQMLIPGTALQEATPAITNATGGSPDNVEAAENLLPLLGLGKKARQYIEDTRSPTGAIADVAGEKVSNLARGAKAMNAEDVNAADEAARNSVNSGYGGARANGTMIDPAQIQTLFDSVKNAVHDPAQDPLKSQLHPATASALADLEQAASTGKPVGLGALEATRQMLQGASGQDAGKASAFRHAFDDGLNNMSGDDAFNQARAEASKRFALQDIGNIIKSADGDPARIRTALTRFVNDPQKTMGYSPSELEKAQTGADISLPGKLLRTYGKTGIDAGSATKSGVAIGPAVLAGLFTHGLGALNIIPGTAARYIDKFAARGRLQDFYNEVANRPAPAPQTTPITSKQVYPSANGVGPQPQLKLPAPAPEVAVDTAGNANLTQPNSAPRQTKIDLGSNSVGTPSGLSDVVAKSLSNKFGEPGKQQMNPGGRGTAPAEYQPTIAEKIEKALREHGF